KKILMLLLGLSLTACSVDNSSKSPEPITVPTTPAKDTGLAATPVSAKSTSTYIGLPRQKLVQCMGQPSRYLKTSEHEYFSYITPKRCDVIFIVDNPSSKVIDVKYRMPHPLVGYSYDVKPKQCPFEQSVCLQKA